MGELDLLAYVRRLAERRRPDWLTVGVGDDAAVLRTPGGDQLAATTDMLIEGTHFAPGTPPEQVGYKAVARCLSDLAAMAARPLCTLAAVAFGPAAQAAWARRLCEALHASAEQLGAPLVGGDVCAATGPLTLTLTALGLAGPRGPVTRAGAQPGDALCVTGRLGGSLRGRHLSFRPRTDEALALADRWDVHAMIDISDGLSTDALHLAAESGVGLEVRAQAVPVSDDARAAADEAGEADGGLSRALGDGEDYELLFCLPAEQARGVAEAGPCGTAVTVIGAVTAGPGCVLLGVDGSRRELRGQGWEHEIG